MKTSASKKVNLATATSPYTVQMASDVEVLTFYNDKTLAANFAIQASGTPATDCTVSMIFTGSITTGVNTFSIFGVTLNPDVVKEPFFAMCFYTNADWTVIYGRLRGASYVTGGGLSEGTNGGLQIASNVITNTMVNSAAGIIYSKLVLTNSIVNTDIAPAAALAYSKLNLAGAILNADLAGSITYAKLAITGGIVNADISAAAVIAHNKMAALTASKLLQSDGSGVVSVVDTATAPTITELNYVKGVTSALQTQVDAKTSKTYVDAADTVLTNAIAAINPSVKTSTTVTGTTVLTSATIKNNILCNTGGGGFTTTLPLISTLTDGYEVTMSCVGHISNVATIAANAADHLVNQDSSGAVGTVTMAGYFKSFTLQADAATHTWYVIQVIA